MSWLFKLAIASMVLALPTHVGAQVLISEIMYDVPGADTGAGGEWIEIYHKGGESIDVSSWVLFEADTNHKLVVYRGSPSLASGDYAVIVHNPELFLSAYPNVSGTILDSSFSLANEAGEVLALKNGAGEIQDEISYTSSDGASGDGNTLNREGGGWRVALPTPGGAASSEVAVAVADEGGSTPTMSSSGSRSTSSNTTALGSQKTTTSVSSGSTFAITFPGNRTAVAGGAEFYGVDLVLPKNIRESDVSVQWNFGNGATYKGRRPFHSYDYPGSYVVTVEAYARSERAQTRFTVTVVPPELSLEAVSSEAISVINHSSREVNLSLWSLRSGSAHFVLPEHTILLPRSSVTFTRDVTGLAVYNQESIALLYPSGEVVNVIESEDADNELTTEDVVAESFKDEATLVTSLRREIVEPTYVAEALVAAPAAARPPQSSNSLFYWLLGLLGLILIAFAVVLVIRRRGDQPLVVQGYEIVEDEEDNNIKT